MKIKFKIIFFNIIKFMIIFLVEETYDYFVCETKKNHYFESL